MSSLNESVLRTMVQWQK